MARPIDADTLPVHKAYCVDEAGWGANFYVVDKSDIDNAPTIDAVPVVRCKDCKYFNRKVSVGGFCRCGEVCGGHPLMRANKDFCSYGERREDGKSD